MSLWPFLAAAGVLIGCGLVMLFCDPQIDPRNCPFGCGPGCPGPCDTRPPCRYGGL